MSSKMLSKKIPAAVMAVVMMLTMFAFTGLTGADEVYAASLSKPSVTLTNVTPTSIKISWKKVSGASKYTIYRSTKKSSGYKSIKTTTSASYTNSKLTCGKTYYYKVKAISGKKSATSSIVSKKAVPGKVSGFKVSYTCSTLKPSWSKQSGVSGYQVYYKASSSGSYKKLTSTTSTSYTQKNLKLGTTRYYKVRAYKKVGKTTYYGAFTSVISKKTAHAPSTSWFVTKEATCASTGTKRNKCKYCNKTYTVTIPKDSIAHSYVKKVVTSATCTTEGKTVTCCKYCSKVIKTTIDPALGHKYEFSGKTTDGFDRYVCSNCGKEKIDTVCMIDITNKTVSLPQYAEFIDATETEVAQVHLNPVALDNVVIEYNIVGEAEEFTIDVNAAADCGVKLSGVKITNTNAECIKIKDKSPDESADTSTEVSVGTGSTETTVSTTPVEDIIPVVSLSAADGTENTLTVTTAGNAIESKCELELKGHGMLNLNSVSTALDCQAKLEIKNLTLNITSTGNRGIDTKKDNLNAAGLIISTDYSNITVKPNANITINSYDDGIRCKNMTFDPLDEAAGDVATVVNVVSEIGDGLQLEGKKGITMYSGIMTLQGGKTGMNNKSGLKSIVAPAQLTANGIIQ